MFNVFFSMTSEAGLLLAINIVWQVTLFTATGLIAAKAFRRHPAVRYWMLCSSLLLIIVSPMTAIIMQSYGTGYLSIPSTADWRNPAGNAANSTGLRIDPSGNQAKTGASDRQSRANSEPLVVESQLAFDGHESQDGMKRHATHRPIPSTPTWTAKSTNSWPLLGDVAVTLNFNWIAIVLRICNPILLTVWFIGTSALIVQLVVSSYRLGQILESAKSIDNASLRLAVEGAAQMLGRRGFSSMVPLISDRVSGPLAAGVWRPRVVLPAEMISRLNTSQLREILVHEMAHVLRRDQIVALLQNVVAAFFWFHPLIHVLNRRLAQAREEVCDNYVLTATDAPSYSRTLLALAEFIQTTSPIPGAIGLFTSRWKLEDRVAGLLDNGRSRKISLDVRARISVIILAFVMIGVASVATLQVVPVQARENNQSNPDIEQVDNQAKKRRADAPANSDSQKSITIRGRIVSSDGEPVAGAFVSLAGEREKESGHLVWETLAEAVSEKSGDYSLSVKGVSSKTHAVPVLIARTNDSAISWTKKIDLDSAESRINLSLRRQQLIKAKFVDIEGKPAANIPISLVGVSLASSGSDDPENFLGFINGSHPKACPLPLKTDDNGLLTIPNIPAKYGVTLEFAGNDQFARQGINLNSGESETRQEDDRTYRPVNKNISPDEVAIIPLAPAQIFEGVVFLGDTDKPAANSKIRISSSQHEKNGSWVTIESVTDERGRFRLNPHPGIRFGIIAYAPTNGAYQTQKLDDLEWKSGDASKKIVMRLKPGIQAQGKVVDANSNEPVVGAYVQYIPDGINNPYLTPDVVTGWQNIQRTDQKGQFNLTVLPGPGMIIVHASGEGPDYVLQIMGSREVRGYNKEGQPGGYRMYAHAFQKINPPAPNENDKGIGLDELTIKLEPGSSVVAKLVDQQRKPVERALVLSQLDISPFHLMWRYIENAANQGKARIRGLRAGEKYPVHFLDRNRKLGATAIISLDNPNPTIELKPCASAKIQFVDPQGKRIRAGVAVGIHMVLTPGRSGYNVRKIAPGEMFADLEFVETIDQDRHVTDANGVMTYNHLIPGATYRFCDVKDAPMDPAHEFVAESGKTHEMKVVIDLDEK